MSMAMKLVSLVGLTLQVSARLQAAQNSKSKHSDSSALVLASGPRRVHYGDSRCPCIGFDNIDGETVLEVEIKGEMLDISYPADLGARCEAWDDNRHLQCKAGLNPGNGKGWCAQKWCYVDPCNCAIDVMPKISALYNTEASYQGKPLFWSYATCGGKDVFTKKVPKLGRPKCRCIGFAGVSGTTEISFADGLMVEYPAELGTSCRSWDLNIHPECTGDKVPSWCKANWCYVDPCDCELPGDTVPKISAYLPEATFTGKNLYYSYETCGSPDTWTKDNHKEACVNQATKDECAQLLRCSWTGERCLGSELVNHPLCKKALPKYYEKQARPGTAKSACTSCGSSLLVAAVIAIAATCSVRM